jgi:hypothetical protein
VFKAKPDENFTEAFVGQQMIGQLWIVSAVVVLIGICYVAHDIYQRKATRREKIAIGIGCGWITLALYMTFGVAGLVFIAAIAVLASLETSLKYFP